MAALRRDGQRLGGPAVAAAVCLGVVLSGLPAASAHAEDGMPPDLPAAGNRCVGASPVRFAGVPWPVARMAPQLSWPLSRGAGVTVAVVDSGVSGSAPALAGAVQPGVNVVSRGAGNSDCQGRGTALAEIVAARPTTGTGVVGMAPAASVLPIRITDANGQVPPTALASAISAATSMGPSVILVGTGGPDSAALQAAVSAAVARDIVVVAAVNDRAATMSGQQPDVWYPAAYQDVIAVAGVNVDGTPSQDSPPGANVDLLAPDVNAVTGGPVGDGHYTVGGSAVAAAYVAGAVALLRSYRPALNYTQVRERLELTAEHPSGAARTATAGAGTIDPYAALSAVDPAQAAQLSSPPPQRVVLPAPPAPDSVIARARLLGGVIVVFTIAVLGAIATIGTRRRRLRARRA
jgi:membrane-anchored mycosin MYCP